MLILNEKKDCCGCHACVQRCPRKCIRMVEDAEGFLYPEVNKADCIHCGLCEQVCPMVHPCSERQPLEAYAARNPDEEIRRLSSSGGVFTLLAERVIEEGGVVFGAAFNSSWEVEHQYTETKEGIAAFRGSKYVQSRIGESFRQAQGFLKAGRKVLFSGTPCQIRALKLYLRREDDKLLTVDIVCHGVPSPGVFRTYLHEEMQATCMDVDFISFRDKSKGWRGYSFKLVGSQVTVDGQKRTISSTRVCYEHPYLRGFSADLYLRPSCHTCPVKGLRSGSDITLADYWGVEKTIPALNDNKGISAILINSEKGLMTVQDVEVELYRASYADICQKNTSIILSTPISTKRHEFFTPSSESFSEKIQRLCQLSPWEKIRRKLSAVKKTLIRLIRR